MRGAYAGAQTMTTRTSSYRTFAEIARETAKSRHHGSWRAYSDDFLSSLIHDFWCGRFIDDKGQSCTFNFQPPGRTSARDSITREVVWRCLGDARPRIVSEFHGGTPPPWDILATAKIEDYGRAARQLLENLALSEADASAWMKQYDEEQTVTQPAPHVATKQDQQTYDKLMKAREAVEILRDRHPSWPDEQIARTLSKGPDIGYSLETLRKIVRRTYPALKRLGIPR